MPTETGPNKAYSAWRPGGRAGTLAAVTWSAAVVAAVLGPSKPRPAAPSAAMTPAPEPLPTVVIGPRDPDGQNVIYGDQVMPYPNPFAGTQYANILAGRPGTTTDAATRPRPDPYDAGDPIVLPTDD